MTCQFELAKGVLEEQFKEAYSVPPQNEQLPEPLIDQENALVTTLENRTDEETYSSIVQVQDGTNQCSICMQEYKEND